MAVFLESHSDVSCLRRTILGTEPNEKISLIEGVAPSDARIDRPSDNDEATEKEAEIACTEEVEGASLESSECNIEDRSRATRSTDVTVMRLEQEVVPFIVNYGSRGDDEEKTTNIERQECECDSLVTGIKLTQQYVEDDVADIGQEISDTVDDPIFGIGGDPIERRTKIVDTDKGGEMRKTVKISRSVRVQDSEECLLLDERRSDELQSKGSGNNNNKKTFPSVSKLGKKAKKDSNCKIS